MFGYWTAKGPSHKSRVRSNSCDVGIKLDVVKFVVKFVVSKGERCIVDFHYITTSDLRRARY